MRVQPRASRSEIVGWRADGALSVRVAAPPVEGAANAALIAFLAETLCLRKADITIRSGETGRIKLLHLAGDSAILLKRLDGLLG